MYFETKHCQLLLLPLVDVAAAAAVETPLGSD